MVSKGIIVALISLALLVQGVYGITVSSTQFKDGITNGINIDLNAALDTTVNAEISSSPTIYMDGGSCSINEHHQVTDSDGNHAEVNAVVTNAESITYSDTLDPEEGNLNYATGYVGADQLLDASNADLIKVSQSASNALLDKASSSIKIGTGSLFGYHGFAYADTSQAVSGQEFSTATGLTVKTDEIASNHLGTSNSFVDIVNGEIDEYVPVMGAGAMAVGDGGPGNGLMTMYGAQRFGGDKVTVGSSAASSDGSKTSDIKTTIKNGGADYYITGSGVNFMGSPVVGSFQLYGVMGGTNVKITDTAFNAGNKASTSMEVKKGALYSLYSDPEDTALAGSISGDPSSSDVFTGMYYEPVGVSAEKLTLTASATNDLGINAYHQTVVPSPYEAVFYNAAYVSADNPYVNQEQVTV